MALEVDVWTNYFRTLTRSGDEVLATVTLLRDQADAVDSAHEGRTLRAIGYDADRDVLELRVGGDAAERPALRFFIAAPRRITVEESSEAKAIVIEDAGGARTAIGLRRFAEGG